MDVMRLYIDKNNLISLLLSRDIDGYEDCLRMVKRQLDVYFFFSKKNLDKDMDQDLITMMSTFTTGVGNSKAVFMDTAAFEYPERPMKGNSSSSFTPEQLSSVYLLSDNPEDKLDFIKERGNILIGGINDEINTLKKLIFDDYQYACKIKESDFESKGWNALKEFAMPCTDILLIDNYILSDESLYDYNIYPLLRMISRCGSGKQINIVIVTKKRNHNRALKYDFEPDWKNIKSKIKFEIKKECGSKSVNVTFVLLPKDIDEHDRTIITNYVRMHSGDSYNYLNSSGTYISKSHHLLIDSLAHADNQELANEVIKIVQSKTNEAKNRNPDLIIGDKVCSFIHF